MTVLSLSAKPAHSHGRFVHPKLSLIYPAWYPLLWKLFYNESQIVNHKLWCSDILSYLISESLWKSLSWNNLGFFHNLVHFYIVRVSVLPHNTLELLKFYFGFQLVKFFFGLNELPLPSYVRCIWIRLIKYNLRILDSYNTNT